MTQRTLFVVLFFVAATSLWGQTYPNLNQSTLVDNGLPGAVGWGSCADCAGGIGTATIASSPFQGTPSLDGSSMDFYINGTPYSDGLWWYKVGPNDAVSHLALDFWVYVNSNTSSAQALEFDAFQFNSGVQYMFGTQCDYFSGTWDVWNAAAGSWVQTSYKCNQFQPNTWYHLQMIFHRSSPDNREHYDSITIQQAGKRGSTTLRLNISLPAGVMPPTWSDNMGVQFQMDVGPTGTPMQEWVDEVTLATY